VPLADENAKLRAELAATMLPYKGHTVKIIGGVATVFLHGGACTSACSADRAAQRGRLRVALAEGRVDPDSPAERIDAVAPALCEMGCVGERLERVS
jgi:hypothetical protein